MKSDAKTPVWLVTGASSGFGRALCHEILRRGQTLVPTQRSIADDLGFEGVERLDVTDAASVRALVDRVVARHGRIDYLVNNAGAGYSASVEESDPADLARLMAVNLQGPLAAIQAVLPSMRARGSGTIVNIGSAAGLRAGPGSGLYAATKFAIEGLSQSLRKEVEPLGLRVIVVNPGAFRTNFRGAMAAIPTMIDDYRPTVGRRGASLRSGHGRQPGDPERAARIIVDAAQSAAPPNNLVLGRIARDEVEAHLSRMLEEVRQGRSAAEAADFPADASR